MCLQLTESGGQDNGPAAPAEGAATERLGSVRFDSHI